MKIIIFLILSFIVVGSSYALDLSGVVIDTIDYEVIAVFLIGALVVYWGIRKGLELLEGRKIGRYLDAAVDEGMRMEQDDRDRDYDPYFND